jgi:hypothetical protein
MMALPRLDGFDAWTGEQDSFRRPPSTLVGIVEAALASRQTVDQFLRASLEDLIIRQHRENALRKLAADPSHDTSKFLLEDGGLIPLSHHQPGTSNPRYWNAVQMLADLGYLAPDGTSVTPDGEELLQRICERPIV